MDAPATLLEAAPIVAQLQIKLGQTVGDFGSGGSGHIALEISRAVGSDGTVLLFDVQKTALSATMSALQTRGAANVQSVWTDLETYQGASGVQDGSIDAGLLINVLHQSKLPKAILTEIGRMLKTGARLVVVDWLKDQSTPLAPAENMRVGADHVAQIAAAANFAMLEKFSSGPWHWGLVLVKV